METLSGRVVDRSSPTSVADGDRFLALPPSAERGRCFALAATFGILFLLLYGGASRLAAYVPWRFRVDLPFELAIPFSPWSSLLYLAIGPLLCLGPFVLRRWRLLLPLVAVLTSETLVAAVCFVLLPVTTSFPPRETAGAVGLFFGFADLLNLEGNYLPSLHVAYALTAALAYGKERAPLVRIALFAGFVAMTASTLLMHEHHVVDAVAGMVLAAFAWVFVGRWAARQDVLDAVDVELLTAENFLRFGRRHRRYWTIAAVLAFASVPRWRKNRVLRTGFCTLQAADDLLDGDRPSAREPLEVTDELIAQIETRRFRDDDLGRLAKAFTADLLEVGGSEALEDVARLLRIMQEDRRRALEDRVMDGAELREHLRQTFHLSVDLMLIAGRTELRAADVPELIEAFGWCSTVRDLEEDLSAGRINVPAEVITRAWSEGVAANSPELLETAAVHEWQQQERDRAVSLLDAADQRLAVLRHRRGAGVLRMFSRSIRRYAQQSADWNQARGA